MKNFKLALALLAAVLVFAGGCNSDPGYEDDDGTSGGGTGGVTVDYEMQNDAWVVYTAAGLQAWADAVAQEGGNSISCTLAADIDLSGIDWTPVGTENNPYTRTFDGAGHTVSNLVVYLLGATTNIQAGFFGVVGSDGAVKNLGLENASLTVIGSAYNYVGGIVGYNNGGTITGCWSTGNIAAVNGSRNYVGGIVGEHRNNGEVAGCYSTANVAASNNRNNSNNSYAGGIAGQNNGSGITACYYSTGVVTASNYAGGIAGQTLKPITACYSTSASISGSSAGGGIAGNNYNNESTMTACYWSGASNGVGSGTDSTEKVTNEDDATWENAMDAMNSALETNESDWRYEENTGSNKDEAPLTLKEV